MVLKYGIKIGLDMAGFPFIVIQPYPATLSSSLFLPGATLSIHRPVCCMEVSHFKRNCSMVVLQCPNAVSFPVPIPLVPPFLVDRPTLWSVCVSHIHLNLILH